MSVISVRSARLNMYRSKRKLDDVYLQRLKKYVALKSMKYIHKEFHIGRETLKILLDPLSSGVNSRIIEHVTTKLDGMIE